ncbi:type 2 periplasmic-binding domain-containing protein [Corynebacterium glutamicum]|uniref:hypothetical protein n=1 Tax=Corynebacterium glutamicum TaxID=1718 RepID=UPI00094509E3|nr:hypothetical protein [Corynebacterium glutamicum]OKX83717.1 hypothetical protein AUO96_13250 [Corynebacterium glutamicum]QDX75317.1 hypothetical protein AKL15_05930 [Corynebacterium glutamicum]QDX78083.1 hypothetical protein AKL16_05925 [Corynebacterium glutamicum]QYR18560.1 hypothetical protein JJQ73_05930 [Corynebacterium glutamicum]TWS35806.1 hypothetical protein AKJ20_06110 [Corynebacterium glutamicum]
MKNVGKRILVLALGASVAGCSTLSQEPSPPVPLGNVDTVQIVSPNGEIESFVLGKLYETALVERGRSASVQLIDGDLDEQLSMLRDDSTDLVIACSGQLLEYYNPDLASEFAVEYANQTAFDKNSGEWREKVYDALQGSLPYSIVATDPSNAIGCKDDTSLPQNIVPIYRKPNLDRDNRDTLNFVSGSLGTSDLEALVKDAQTTGTTSETALDFLLSKGFSR